jgi:hypothetical protein
LAKSAHKRQDPLSTIGSATLPANGLTGDLTPKLSPPESTPT